MERISLTAFGRQPVSAGQLATAARSAVTGTHAPVSKWQILRDATTARKTLGIKDRDLAVLGALLSFHKGANFDDPDSLIVFPSNRTLCERAHGMAESTLRRHLAALVDAGLILRHDSPNGKRYARRGPGGVIATAFGFDLRPLMCRADELADIADRTRQEETALRLLRERCVLMIRDIGKLISFAIADGTLPETSDLADGLSDAQRRLRHKPTSDGLAALQVDCQALLTAVQDTILTPDPGGNDIQNERHQQSSNTDYFDSELPAENGKPDRPALPPLLFVLKACPEITIYASDPIRSYEDLVRAAYFIHPMIGITPEGWQSACQIMGIYQTAVTICCLLQKADELKSPGAYLRVLSQKAQEGGFSALPMVMALVNKSERLAA